MKESFRYIIDKILIDKNKNPKTNIDHYEKEIDQLVYNLYQLNPQEIRIMETVV